MKRQYKSQYIGFMALLTPLLTMTKKLTEINAIRVLITFIGMFEKVGKPIENRAFQHFSTNVIMVFITFTTIFGWAYYNLYYLCIKFFYEK